MEENKMQDNYKTIQQKLRNREPFKGNSMSASRDYGVYSVWSYNTLIADYKLGKLDDGEPRITFNETKYSVTTSKHQNIIRRAWGIN
jgi:hypothetical protein